VSPDRTSCGECDEAEEHDAGEYDDPCQRRPDGQDKKNGGCRQEQKKGKKKLRTR
jgi:hypothetical protein